jgi:esterase/lipase
MKKYQRPESIDMSDLLNEIEQQTPPESVERVKQLLAKINEKFESVNYSYQISISQEDNDWNDPLNDHWDNY